MRMPTPQEMMDGRIRPIVAARAFHRLIHNKDDTAAVALFITALNGEWFGPTYERFRHSPDGERLLANKTEVYSVLSDVGRLRTMPKGSLGRVYIDELDACGLTIDGFRSAQAEAQNFDHLPADWRLPQYRILDIHDVLHTLVGWARDPLAEVCILEFQGVQYRAPGWRALAYAAGLEVKRRFPDTPVFACLREARRIALSINRWVLDYDWEGNLERPLAAIRCELGVETPRNYLSVFDVWQERNRSLAEEAAQRIKRRSPDRAHGHRRDYAVH